MSQCDKFPIVFKLAISLVFGRSQVFGSDQKLFSFRPPRYIYICVCFCHPSSSYIPIVSRLVLFWSSFGRRKTRMKWSDKRSSLWAPHISRTLGQWRPPVFFGFGCWNLWWFYGILNHTTGRLLWIGYSDIWCCDAILVVLLRKASQPPSSLGNAAGNISCSQLDSRVV